MLTEINKTTRNRTGPDVTSHITNVTLNGPGLNQIPAVTDR